MKKTLILGAIIGLTLSACSTEYMTYSGSPVMIGQGGASKNVGGVEFWVYGTPPRPYQIIGYIEDSRPGGPPVVAARAGAIAAKARASGADAVIMNSDTSQYMGTYSTGSFSGWTNGSSFNGFGSGTSVAITRRNSTFLAIKYINTPPKQRLASR
jgi:hypothetical protein